MQVHLTLDQVSVIAVAPVKSLTTQRPRLPLPQPDRCRSQRRCQVPRVRRELAEGSRGPRGPFMTSTANYSRSVTPAPTSPIGLASERAWEELGTACNDDFLAIVYHSKPTKPAWGNRGLVDGILSS